MTQHESEQATTSSSSSKHDRDVPQPPAASGPATGILLAGALVGSLLAWGFVSWSENFFRVGALVQVSAETQKMIDEGAEGGAVMGAVMGDNDMAELAAKASEGKRSVALKNNILAMSLLGLAVCGAFGLAGGVAGKSAADTVVGLVLGAVFGAIAGAVAAFAGTVVDGQLRQIQAIGPEIRAVLTHATSWLIVGAAVGATIGYQRRRTSPMTMSLSAGVLGGLLAACIYSPTAAFLFPMDQSELIVPGGNVNRLYWIGLFALTIVVASVYLKARPKK